MIKFIDAKAAHFFAGCTIFLLFMNGLTNADMDEYPALWVSLITVFGFAVCKEANDPQFEWADILWTLAGGIVGILCYKFAQQRSVLQLVITAVGVACGMLIVRFILRKLKSK